MIYYDFFLNRYQKFFQKSKIQKSIIPALSVMIIIENTINNITSQINIKNISQKMIKQGVLWSITYHGNPNFNIWAGITNIISIIQLLTLHINEEIFVYLLILNLAILGTNFILKEAYQILSYLKKQLLCLWDIITLIQFCSIIFLEQKNYQTNIYFCLVSLNLLTPIGLLCGLVLQVINLNNYKDCTYTILFILEIIYIRSKISDYKKSLQIDQNNQNTNKAIKILENSQYQGIFIYNKRHQELGNKNDQQQYFYQLPIYIYTMQQAQLLDSEDLKQNCRINKIKEKYMNIEDFINKLTNKQTTLDDNQTIVMKDTIGDKKYVLQIVELEDDSYLISYYYFRQNYLVQKQTKGYIKFQSVIGSLDHKLKTPISSAIVHLKAAKQDSEIKESFKQDYILPAYYNCQQQLYWVQDVIDYISWDFDIIQPVIQTVNVMKVLKKTLAIVQNQCQAKQIKLLFTQDSNSVTDKVFMINTDQNKLTRVLLNLLNNAYRFTQIGGVINLDIQTKINNQISFIIEDSGTGISDEQISIINRELRSSTNKSRNLSLKLSNFNNNQNYQYQGISLLIANRLIQQLNNNTSSLQIDNTKKTRFKFIVDNFSEQTSNLHLKSLRNIDQYKRDRSREGSILPSIFKNRVLSIFSPPQSSKSPILSPNLSLNDEEIANEPLCYNLFKFPNIILSTNRTKSEQLGDDNLDTQRQFRKLTTQPLDLGATKEQDQYDKIVLIVDDEPFNNISLTKILKKLGIKNIGLAYDGKQALKFIEQNNNNIRFLLMDIDMPIMDGIQATRIIIEKQQNKIFGHFPIYGCTAHQDVESHQLCLDSGMLAVLQKPVFQKDIMKILKLVEQPDEIRFISEEI
ncbi:hypothetical protein pb186bvf_004126 [Paramecium bursaria]